MRVRSRLQSAWLFSHLACRRRLTNADASRLVVATVSPVLTPICPSASRLPWSAIACWTESPRRRASRPACGPRRSQGSTVGLAGRWAWMRLHERLPLRRVALGGAMLRSDGCRWRWMTWCCCGWTCSGSMSGSANWTSNARSRCDFPRCGSTSGSTRSGSSTSAKTNVPHCLVSSHRSVPGPTGWP